MTLTAKKKVSHKEELPPPISTISSEDVLQSVWSLLGKPRDVCIGPSLTRATPITQSSFRVNVYQHIESLAKLTDSFFVRVDGIGQVVESKPPITKRYQ